MTHNEYAKGRVGFAIINNNVLFQKDDNHVYSKQWLCEQYGYSEDDYESIIRGGLFPDRITLSLGSQYDSINLDKLSANIIITIIAKYREVYGKAPEVIYNGQYPGEIGETWKPRQVITL